MTNKLDSLYDIWRKNPTKENMSAVITALQPVISVEVHRYTGPKSLLRGQARLIALDAVRSYDPASGARLSSWVVTNMQKLNRYGKNINRPVYAPEASMQQAAAVNAKRQQLIDDLGDEPSDDQLADATGLSVKRIQAVRAAVPAYAHAGGMAETAGAEGEEGLAIAVSGSDDPVLETTIQGVHNSLEGRDKAIFELKTGRGPEGMLDNKTIARRLGVSEGLISQRSLAIAKQIKDAYGKI